MNDNNNNNRNNNNNNNNNKVIIKSCKDKEVWRITQCRQNRMFATEQKKVYNELNGVASGESLIADAEESKKFWSEIWSIEKEHNRQAEWLQDLKREQSSVNMGDDCRRDVWLLGKGENITR